MIITSLGLGLAIAGWLAYLASRRSLAAVLWVTASVLAIASLVSTSH